MDPQWIMAISSVVTALGVGLIAWQAYTSAKQLEVLKQQIAADHERSRRQRAIDVLENWTKTLDMAHPSARSVIEGLSIEDCRKLKTKEPIKISASKLHYLEVALKGLIQQGELRADEQKQITLSEKHVSQLHYLAISHLNSLEVALQSWLNGVADKSILEHELQYLVKPGDGHYVLANFREVMGVILHTQLLLHSLIM